MSGTQKGWTEQHRRNGGLDMNTVSIQKIGITDVYADAIVNAANEGLWAGSGVCGAIFEAAGYTELQKACSAIGHCPAGSAVITGGFRSKAKYIIHAVGPRYKDGKHGEDKLLYGAYQTALRLAVENGCSSIAFPLISAGVFGYPVADAWAVALRACRDFFQQAPGASLDVTFAVLDENILKLGNKELIEVLPGMKVAEKSDWKTLDLPKRHDIFFIHRDFTEEQMQRLRRGNIPREMEDKWFWYMEGDTLYAHRSWTGICIYVIKFFPTGKHKVLVNRDPEQYGCTSAEQDFQQLHTLLNWWAQSNYDYYGQWLSETVNSLKKQGLIKEYLTIGGQKKEAVFFHKPQEPHGWLSNWHPSEFTVDGIRFTSAEQYIMYQKCVLFGDTTAAREVLETDDPALQQAIGRDAGGYVDRVWAGMRQIIAIRALRAKFSLNKDLKEKLLATGDAILVECAKSDPHWACGIGLYDDRRLDAKNWPGKNLLGFALMEVREQLK